MRSESSASASASDLGGGGSGSLVREERGPATTTGRKRHEKSRRGRDELR